jgi:hypothetical protein
VSPCEKKIKKVRKWNYGDYDTGRELQAGSDTS